MRAGHSTIKSAISTASDYKAAPAKPLVRIDHKCRVSRLLPSCNDASRWHIATLKRFSPLAFPLMVERLRESLSTEKLQDRLQRLLRDLHKAADA